jgi:hypothetical protein
MTRLSTPAKWVACLVLSAVASSLGSPPAKAQTPPAWPPVPPEELALKDNAFDPGSAALILEYEVQTDNTKSTETTYKRIKIFREEGKKFADVEIRYFEKFTRVEEIHARVTSPSGKAEDFNGAIYDKEVVKLKKFRFNAKTFTLPNVEVGSVIEYSYRMHWHSDIPDVIKNPSRYLISEAIAYPAAEWDIQQDIAVRHGRFTLRPVKGAGTATYSHDLPKDAVKRSLPDGTEELEVNYIPAFQKEEYSPPEENLKIREDIFYSLGMYNDTTYYWLSLARREAEYYEKFIGKPKDVQKEAERLFHPGDTEETKLQKIYCPERFLPWEETDAGGIRVDRFDTKLETTPLPESKDAVTRRAGDFHLNPEGNLDGKLSVIYEGQEALQRRLKAIDQDEAERRKGLEDEVQHLLPQGGSAKLLSAEGWTASDAPLKAQFEIQVPSFASRAGQRLLMPVGVFHSSGQHPFASTRRTHPVYFEYPTEIYEEVKLVLPPGIQIEALPGGTKIERGTIRYESSAEKQGEALQLKRTFKMTTYYLPPETLSRAPAVL